MKKVLALLTLSMLMIASLIIGVNATILDDDIGFYVRFDSQAKVEKYAHGEKMHIVYDSDVNALRFSSKVDLPTTSTTDWNFYLNFGAKVDFAKYPFMRITYMSPTTGINGENTASKANVYLYPGSPTADFQGVIAMNTGKDNWHRTLINWNNVTDNRTNKSKELGSIRMDFPKGIADYSEYYIYDVGFFATQEAAYSYKPEQSFAMLDFSDPYYATEAAWRSKSGYTLEYDEENEALKFLDDGVTADGENEKGDRVRGQAFSPLNYFSASHYNYVSTKYKTNDSIHFYFLHTGYYMPTDAVYTNSDTGISVNASNNLPMIKSETEWKISSGPLTLIADTAEKPDLSKTVVQFYADVMNNNGSGSAGKWRTVKYVAYYKTAVEAALETQAAPKNLVASAPTTKAGKGTISGVTTEMEYRASDSAYDAYTPITEDGDLSVDAGKTYYIRYAEKDGYNAGYAASVSVPMYWNLDITAVKYSDGETVNATITKTDKQNWTITVPKGVDVTKLKPVYTFESGASETYANNNSGVKSREASLWLNADNSTAVKLVSGSTAFGDNIDENNKIQLHIYQTYSLFDVVNITFVEAEDDTDLIDIVGNKIVEAFIDSDGKETNYAHYYFLAEDSTGDIATVVTDMATKIAARYNTVYTPAVTVSEFKTSEAGTADNKAGTDGSCKITIKLTKDEATKDFVISAMPIPAAHYRVILDFGDPVLLQNMSVYSATKDNKMTENLITEIISDETALGGSYMKITKDDSFGANGEFNISFTPGKGTFPVIEQLADYPVVVYRDKRTVRGNYQIFYSTDGGACMAYQAKWQESNDKFDETIWKVNFEGGINDQGGTNAEWASKLTSIRFDFMRNTTSDRKSVCIDYIGFFATEADAQAFIEDSSSYERPVRVETLGAQIRTEKDETSSIRFGAKVNVGEDKLITAIDNDTEEGETITYESLKATTTFDNLKFGMLIVPKEALGETELTFENLTVNADKTTVNEGRYTINGVEVADVACNNIYKVDANGEYFEYTAVVTGIKDTSTELVARPYATYTTGSDKNIKVKYLYFEPITRSYDSVKEKIDWDK